MESGSTTSTDIYSSHALPHQQFSSRIAFANNPNKDNSITKSKLKSLSNKKSTRLSKLPPIARYNSPPVAIDSIKYFNGSADSVESIDLSINDSNTGMDPNLRVRQLERSLKFVKDDCQHILESLHKELEELKTKNKDLQLQLIMNGSLSPQSTQSLTKEQIFVMPLIRGALEPQIGQHINKLETEIKRLRFALEETLRMNSILKSDLHKLKTEPKYNESNNSWLSSPTIGDFNKTFEQMYRSDKELSQTQNTISLPRIANSSSK